MVVTVEIEKLSIDERIKLASSSLPAESLQKLAEDEQGHVREAVAKNANNLANF